MKMDRISIYGAGLIGSGWVTHLLINGYRNLVVYDLSDEKISHAQDMIKKSFDSLKKELDLSDSLIDTYMKTPVYTTDRARALLGADWVIENGPENIGIKQQIIRDIEALCPAAALITSSTSGLGINDIVGDAVHPERIMGVHPYHPVYLLPLVEVVPSRQTNQQTLDQFLALLRKMNKKPVVLRKESPGYIASHLMQALLRESVNLVLGGVCTMKDIEDAFTYGPGMRYALMGPFTTLQLAGGEGGLSGLMNGPIGKSAEEWMASFANWTQWPPEAKEYFADCQAEMDKYLETRDAAHGKNNAQIEAYRDRGLVALLKQHKLI